MAKNTDWSYRYSHVLALVVSSALGCEFGIPTSDRDLSANVDNGEILADLAVADKPPTTCVNLADGTRVLYVNADPSKPWTARCVGGREYLSLPRIQPGENYSRYTAGGFSPGTDVTTRYTAIRLDPQSLLVDVSDQTFATSSGSLSHSGGLLVASMPYGVAMDCVDKLKATGNANIDLRDTAFAIGPNAFVPGGLQAVSKATVSPDGKMAALVGGGVCGWVAAGTYSGNPINNAGGFQLPLQYKP